jgi:hypothetical protein
MEHDVYIMFAQMRAELNEKMDMLLNAFNQILEAEKKVEESKTINKK